jgi:glycosyltransferase involved in cell wall biosynthesis
MMADDSATDDSAKVHAQPRLAIFCDFSYRLDGDSLTAELPFALFLRALASHFAKVIVVGRLDMSAPRFPYEMPGVELAPLPYYRSGADLAAVLRSLPRAMGRFWRLLDGVDIVWVLGPNPPQAIAFALLGLLHRRRVVLGVRQQLPELARHRHPRRPAVWWSASALDRCFRLLARVADVVVVGRPLRRSYQKGRAVHELVVSLVEEQDLLPTGSDQRCYDGPELRMLSVGRADPEKNPLLLLEILRDAVERDPRWRLEICGDGMMLDELSSRAGEMGLSDRVTLHGHVAFGGELWAHYRTAHALVHVSMTEGVPQVLIEAFASRLPVVATAVGAVADVVSDRGLLVQPRDAAGTAGALQRMVDDADLRGECVKAGAAYAAAHTRGIEVAELAQFLKGQA